MRRHRFVDLNPSSVHTNGYFAVQQWDSSTSVLQLLHYRHQSRKKGISVKTQTQGQLLVEQLKYNCTATSLLHSKISTTVNRRRVKITEIDVVACTCAVAPLRRWHRRLASNVWRASPCGRCLNGHIRFSTKNGFFITFEQSHVYHCDQRPLKILLISKARDRFWGGALPLFKRILAEYEFSTRDPSVCCEEPFLRRDFTSELFFLL